MDNVTSEQVVNRLLETLANFRADAAEITRESMFDELAMDSFDRVELTQVIENEYGVVLEGEDMMELTTAGDMSDLIVTRAG